MRKYIAMFFNLTSEQTNKGSLSWFDYENYTKDNNCGKCLGNLEKP